MTPDPEVIARNMVLRRINEITKPNIYGALFGEGLSWEDTVKVSDLVLDELIRIGNEIGDY